MKLISQQSPTSTMPSLMLTLAAERPPAPPPPLNSSPRMSLLKLVAKQRNEQTVDCNSINNNNNEMQNSIEHWKSNCLPNKPIEYQATTVLKSNVEQRHTVVPNCHYDSGGTHLTPVMLTTTITSAAAVDHYDAYNVTYPSSSACNPRSTVSHHPLAVLFQSTVNTATTATLNSGHWFDKKHHESQLSNTNTWWWCWPSLLMIILPAIQSVVIMAPNRRVKCNPPPPSPPLQSSQCCSNFSGCVSRNHHQQRWWWRRWQQQQRPFLLTSSPISQLYSHLKMMMIGVWRTSAMRTTPTTTSAVAASRLRLPLLLLLLIFVASVDSATGGGYRTGRANKNRANYGPYGTNFPTTAISNQTFEESDSSVYFTHMVLDSSNTGYVYIGAVNNIYQLNLQLQLVSKVTMGPSSECAGSKDCPEDVTPKRTNYFNKVLVIDSMHSWLITCGSLRQGSCTVHSLANVSDIIHTSFESVVANNETASTVAFIAPGPEKQPVLYVGATYTQGNYQSDVPAVSSRSLNEISKFFFPHSVC